MYIMNCAGEFSHCGCVLVFIVIFFWVGYAQCLWTSAFLGRTN